MELRDIFERGQGYFEHRLRASNPPIEPILEGQLPFILYPAARLARQAAVELSKRGARPSAFSDRDRNKWGQTLDGIPVIAPEDVAHRYPGHAVLVASSVHDSPIREYLGSLGCRNIYPLPYLNHCLPGVFRARELEQSMTAPFETGACEAILHLHDRLADDESRRVLRGKLLFYLTQEKRLLDEIRSAAPIYFDPEVRKFDAEEVFVDGGAYVGDTLQQFLTTSGGRFRRYFAFEPDRLVVERLRTVAARFADRVECIQAGLSDRTGTLRFSPTGAGDCRVIEDQAPESETLLVVDLDTFFADREPPTLIKMDVEGVEPQALQGAKHLLADVRPSLTISAYHFPSDLWEIPWLIDRLMPGSSFYLRHYSREFYDTVCYAVG